MNLTNVAEEKCINFKLPIPHYQHSGDCLVYSYNADNDYLHVSWSIGNGRVLVFENLWGDSKPISYCLFETEEEYRQSIWEIPWIHECMSDGSNDKFRHRRTINDLEQPDPSYDLFQNVVDDDEYEPVEQVRPRHPTPF